MRGLSDDQKTSYDSDLLTIAELIDLVLNDGTIVKLTSHDVDVGPYLAGFGLDVSNVVLQLGGAGQTTTVNVLPNREDGSITGGVTYTAIEAGLLDSCLATLSLIDWNNPGAIPLVIFTGYCSEAKYGTAGTLELTLNTPMSVDRPICGDVLSQTCRADFGDARCGVDINPFVDGPHVYSPGDSQNLVLSRDEVTPPGFYNNGTVYFREGPNKGLGYEILTIGAADVNGREVLTTKVPLAFDPLPGDLLFLYPGCDKIITSGCTYWNNVQNFQGEPFVADQSNILPLASTKSSGINTGMSAAENWILTQYIKVAFGFTVLFTAGTRLQTATGSYSISGTNVGGNNPNGGSGGTSHVVAAGKTFTGTLIPADAYTGIFNIVGGLSKVVAYDGTLKPIDPNAQAALVAAGFLLDVNLAASQVLFLIDGDNDLTKVKYTFYANGSPT